MGNYCEFDEIPEKENKKITFEIKPRSSVYLHQPLIYSTIPPGAYTNKMMLKYRFNCKSQGKLTTGSNFDKGIEIYRNRILKENINFSIIRRNFTIPLGLDNSIKKHLRCKRSKGRIEIPIRKERKKGSIEMLGKIRNFIFYSSLQP